MRTIDLLLLSARPHITLQICRAAEMRGAVAPQPQHALSRHSAFLPPALSPASGVMLLQFAPAPRPRSRKRTPAADVSESRKTHRQTQLKAFFAGHARRRCQKASAALAAAEFFFPVENGQGVLLM